MNRVSASKIVALRVAKARAKGRGKGSDGDQVDLFEAEGGRKYSRQYRRSKEKELQSKGKGGGPKVLGKARFSSRSEAGRYAANMRWKGQGEKTVSSSKGSMPKGRIVVTKKNLSAPLLAEDAKEYNKDRKAALKAFGDVRNHIYALEIAVNALSNKDYLKLQSHLDELQEDVTSWKSAFDDAGDTPTIKGAIKMTAAVGLGETIKYNMQRVHEKTGWTGDKFEARALELEYALQSAADKNFGVSPQKYKISDAIYRDIEQEDWA